MFVYYYARPQAFPIIMEIAKLEGLDITTDCIKSWSTPQMRNEDVLRGINHVKSLNKKVVIYTNEVFAKERLSKECDIKILDIVDLQKLCLKHKKYEFNSLLV